MNNLLDKLDLTSKGLWFPIVVTILLFITVLIVPKKHITWREVYITFGILGFATWLSDTLVARVFDLIHLGNPKEAGIGDILSYTFIPTSLGVLFFNFFTKKNKWKLTIFFTVLSLLVDIGMQLSGYMAYNGWNLIYSIIFYLFAFRFLLPFHIRLIRGN
ncbi:MULTISPECIES: hypothetical protein [Bacillus]|uniref:Uncharacterized protein n=2 Tax=Bacillus TaxID=1386 RepID=A0A0M4FR24_9BACI|nr:MULTISPECIES: hypothetical protein [Bacillus]ALC81747.1 hypothetical protein AM592_09100 [Bacillus gobiensis]MBP1080827.1 hypothetical protein [Bacillus capparidis]MED1097471.1 hypothetical protein [Bacillus capparidis]